MKRLLTHVIPARNDNYLGNFKHRLEMSVNYFCDNVERTGNIDAYELLITDWNSNTPLREVLNLNAAARKCASFLEVTPDVIAQYKPTDSVLDISTASNVAIRRAEGKFVLFTPADVLFPFQSVNALFALLRGITPFPVNPANCFLGIERFLIPWQASERLTTENLDRYLALHTQGMTLERRIHGISSGEGGHIFATEKFKLLRGFDEDMIYWGGSDVDISMRACQHLQYVKTTHVGVFCYDLQQNPAARKSQTKTNQRTVSETPQVNGENWGLGLADIPKKAALHCPDISNAPNVAVLPYDFQQPTDPLLRNILSHVGHDTFLRVLSSWLHSEGSESTGNWYLSNSFGAVKDIYTFLNNIFGTCAQQESRHMSLAATSALIALMTTLGRFRPTRFLYCPARQLEIAACAIMADNTLEMAGYDHFLGDPTQGAQLFYGLLNSVNFQGFFHLLAGPEDTAFTRLADIPFVGEPYQCIYLDLAFLQRILALLPAQLKPLLNTSCAIICKGEKKHRTVLANTLLPDGFSVAGQLESVTILARGCETAV